MALTTSLQAPDKSVAGIAADLGWLDGVLAAAMSSRPVPGDGSLPGLYLSDRDAAALLASPVVTAANDVRFQEWSSPHLAALSNACNLEPFDQATLLLVFATALDHRYARLCAYLNDDLTRPYATPGLALHLFAGGFDARVGQRRRFASIAPLRALDLIRLDSDGEEAITERPLSMAEDVVAYLLDGAHAAPPPSKSRELILPDLTMAALRQVSQAWRHASAKSRPAVFLVGEHGSGRHLAAEYLAASLDKRLLRRDAASPTAVRDAVFSDAALYISNAEALFEPGNETRSLFEGALAQTDLPLILSLSSPATQPPLTFAGHPSYVVTLPTPGTEERALIWQQEAALAGIDLDPGASALLANAYRLSGGAIATAVERAVLPDGSSAGVLERFAAAAKLMASMNLGRLGQEVTPRFHRQDIVLPQEVEELLDEIIIRVRHRPLVFGEWGFTQRHARSRSLSALFAGPSGTGKTMAAEVIANELGLPLYRVDLSSVVSKYIGETEKNLAQIFNEASASSAVLFFDEADALFGKRSEVKDAHDRYANIEVSYLLQRMEDYDGIIILASNLRQNLDDAFIRRLHLTADFPLPDEAARLEIWRRNLPGSLPLADDVDLQALAERFRLSGGHIRNACVTAAFLAAAQDTLVSMSHLLRAVRREHQKMGKLLLGEDESP